MSRLSKRLGSVATWAVIVVAALGIGSSGLAKLVTTGEWDRLFQSWGYPSWFALVIGSVEVLAAVALFVRRIAWLGALTLAAVMLGAVGTLVLHPGSHFLRGRQAPMSPVTPLVWFALLMAIGIVRWREMRSSHVNA